MKAWVFLLSFMLICGSAFALDVESISKETHPEKFYFYNEISKEYDNEIQTQLLTIDTKQDIKLKSKGGEQRLIKDKENVYKVYENDSLKATAKWLLYVDGKFDSVIDFDQDGTKQTVLIDDEKRKSVCWEIEFPRKDDFEDDWNIPKEHKMEIDGVVIDWMDYKGDTKVVLDGKKVLVWFYEKGVVGKLAIDPSLTVSTGGGYWTISSDHAANKYKINMAVASSAIADINTVIRLGYIYSPDWSAETAVGYLTGSGIATATDHYDLENATTYTSALSVDTGVVAQIDYTGVPTSGSGDLTDGTDDVELIVTFTFFTTKIVAYLEADFKTGVTATGTYSFFGQANRDGSDGLGWASDYRSAISGTESVRNDVTLTTNEDYAFCDADVSNVFDMIAVRNPLGNPVQISGSNASTSQRYEHSYTGSADSFHEFVPSASVSGVFFYTLEHIFEQTTTEAEREAYAWDIRNPYATAVTGTLATTANYVSNGYDVRYGWYEVAADSNVVQMEFEDERGGATAYVYHNTPIKITGWTDTGTIKVEKSTDDAGSWSELTLDTDYKLTDEDDESEVGSNVRIFQLLGTMTGNGATANHLKFTVSGGAPAGAPSQIW